MTQLQSKIQNWDEQGLLQLQSWRHPALTKFFIAITLSGTGKVWAAAAVILVLLQSSKIYIVPEQSTFLTAMLAPLLAWGLSRLLKKSFSRERPSSAIKGFETAVAVPSCRSFPSAHAAASMALATATALVVHPWAGLIAVWAFLVCFSRIYLGVHYVSDVLGGVVLGVFCAFLMIGLS